MLTLAACGGGGSGSGTTTATTAAATTTKAAEAVATTAAKADAAADTGGKGVPMELSIMNWAIADSFSDDGSSDRMLDYYTDKFNVKFVPINVGWDDAEEKSTTWAAAGTLPDVIGAQAMPGSGRYYQWVNDGVVRALPDDLSAYKEVKRIIAQPEVQAYAVKGKNYFFPRQTYDEASWWAMDRGIINRKDWRENLGIAVPKTEQDFIDMWVAFSKSDPHGDGTVVYGMTPQNAWFFFSQCLPSYGYTDSAWTKLEDGSAVIPAMERSTMCVTERDYRLNNWDSPNINYRISAIDVPEKAEMSGVRYGEDWAKFVTDTSGASDEDLYAAMYANWEVNGYKAAKAAITKAIADLGY